MPKIALEGMRFYGYHGFYPEEQVVGTEFMVDVYIDTNLVRSDPDVKIPEDDIQTTLSYETVYQVCKIEMKKPVKLIETLAARILTRLRGQFRNRDDDDALFRLEVKSILVRVSKFHPPLGGRVERAYVEVSG
jgi:dihydroneopterin aldolase